MPGRMGGGGCVVPRPLVRPHVDSAVDYFMASYILSTTFGLYLPQLCARDPLADDGLAAAIRATALASYARGVGDGDRLLEMGRREYATALRRTNSMLVDLTEDSLDRALTTVLMLGLFESVVFLGQRELQNWIAHILGVVALMRMRRHWDVDHVSWGVFLHAGYSIRISCLWRAVPVPDELLALEQTQSRSSPNDPDLLMYSFMHKTTEMSIRGKAPDLDPGLAADTIQLELDMGRASGPDRLDSASEPSPFRMAKRWGGISMLRTLLLEHTFNDPGPSEVRYLQTRISDVAEGILSRLPSFATIQDLSGRFHPWARCLICPLVILHSSPLTTPSIKERILSLLQRLRRDTGLGQAGSTTNLQQMAMRAGYWSV